MSDVNSENKICKNCGHNQESHQEKIGKCNGETNINENSYSWCIANCQRFWK